MRWVTIFHDPMIQVELEAGAVAEFGRPVFGGKPKYLRIGKLSKRALERIRQRFPEEEKKK